MASLKEIKGRINSINGTLKITSAMKMVASAKLHKAQAAIEGMLPYERSLSHILYGFLRSGVQVDSPFVRPNEGGKVAVVAFSSNSSLCGGFNANVIRRLGEVLQRYVSEVGKENVLVYPVGKKVAEAVRKMGYTPEGDYQHLSGKPGYPESAALASQLMDRYERGEIARIDLVYHHFKSTASQELRYEPYLPLDLSAGTEASSGSGAASIGSNTASSGANSIGSSKASAGVGAASIGSSEASSGSNSIGSSKASAGAGAASVAPETDYLVEPSPERVVQSLLPKVLRMRLYTVALDSSASEHAARTLAMQVATDNANDLIQELTLLYNKSRQQAITNELLDIIGGSM